MHSTAAAIGGFVGSLIAMTVLSLLWERLLRRRIEGEVARHMVALAAAWVSGGVLGGFGFARGDQVFTTEAFAGDFVPALVVTPVLYLRALGRRGGKGEAR